VIRATTPRLRTFAVLAVLGLVGGLAAGRPELAAVAAPFAILLGIGLAVAHDLDVKIDVSLDRDRAIEGEELVLVIAAGTTPPGSRLDFEVDLPRGVELAEGLAGGGQRIELSERTVVGFKAGGAIPNHLELKVRCRRWGAHRIGYLRIRSRDVWGLFNYHLEVPLDLSFKVFPETASLRRLLKPIETQLGFGDLVSRQKGEGLEFADLRPMAIGDDPRQINWRVTARGREVWVNDRHPERNSDVVLLVDTLSEPRRGVEVLLDLAVRAAAGLAAGHLRRNDRVGLISFGEPLQWLQPAMGDVQRYRILDTLMESRSRRQMYWRGVSAVPRRALPAKALIIGLSPLLDERAVLAFADLRGRGFDLVVIEIPAEPFVDEPTTPEEHLARRIWELQRDATRNRFVRHGIATVRWNPEEPFQRTLAEVEAFRRDAMRAQV
jgi:uncharacterized protein (DUF58 family)